MEKIPGSLVGTNLIECVRIVVELQQVDSLCTWRTRRTRSPHRGEGGIDGHWGTPPAARTCQCASPTSCVNEVLAIYLEQSGWGCSKFPIITRRMPNRKERLCDGDKKICMLNEED